MTDDSKKRYERHFVEEAAKRLDKSWNLGDSREHPDFIVADGDQKFGLEVCEIFRGRENRNGSVERRCEADTQRKIDAIRQDYEAIQNIPLSVRFVGDTCDDNINKALTALIANNIDSYPIGHHIMIDIDTGDRAGLELYVTKSLKADWFNVKDRVGWVNRNPMKYIIDIVEKKSRKLKCYTKFAGPDVRLLGTSKNSPGDRARPSIQ